MKQFFQNIAVCNECPNCTGMRPVCAAHQPVRRLKTGSDHIIDMPDWCPLPDAPEPTDVKTTNAKEQA